MPLTDKAIKALLPKEKPYRVTDARGLYLEVHPNGSRYWRMKYYYGGKEKRKALGVYPDISLAEARSRLQEAKDMLREGTDPSKPRQRKEALTFEDAYTAWHKEQSRAWSAKYAGEVERRMKMDMLPAVGHLPLGEVTPKDMLEAAKKAAGRGAVYKARRILQDSAQMYRWAVRSGLVALNPAADLAEAIVCPPQRHYAHLKEADLPEFLEKLAGADVFPAVRDAINFLMLTLVRTSEMRFADWCEIDLDRSVWKIPPERMKMSRAHVVPLSKQVKAILERQPAREGLVFRSPVNDLKALSENAVLYAIYRMGYHSRMTGHGFRATASTILHEHRFRPDLIDRQLAHVQPSMVRAAYNHAEYLTEREDMLQWWADFIDALRPR